MKRQVSAINFSSISARIGGYSMRTVVIDGARLWVAILALVYSLALLLVNSTYVVPSFAYQGGVEYRGVHSIFLLASGLAWVAIGALLLPTTAIRPSLMATWILYLMLYVPAQIFPSVYSQVEVAKTALFQVLMFIGFLIVLYVPITFNIEIPTPSLNQRHLTLALGGISVLMYLVIFRAYGFQFSLPSLGDAYDIRSTFNETNASGSSTLAAYAVSWQSRILNPLIMIVGFVRVRPSFMIVGFLGQLAIFSITGLRSVLFSFLMVLLIASVVILIKRRHLLILSVGIVAFVTTSYIVYLLLDVSMPVSTFVRRMLIVPGVLMASYLEFFESNAQVALPIGFLAPFLEVSYPEGYTYAVGSWFMPGTGVNMNAGLWPDAYAQFGYIGIVVFSIICSLYFCVLNSAAKGKDPRIVLPLAGMVGWTLVNSAMFTSLLTHGLLFALVLIYLLPGEEPSSSRRDDE